MYGQCIVCRDNGIPKLLAGSSQFTSRLRSSRRIRAFFQRETSIMRCTFRCWCDSVLQPALPMPGHSRSREFSSHVHCLKWLQAHSATRAVSTNLPYIHNQLNYKYRNALQCDHWCQLPAIAVTTFQEQQHEADCPHIYCIQLIYWYTYMYMPHNAT